MIPLSRGQGSPGLLLVPGQDDLGLAFTTDIELSHGKKWFHNPAYRNGQPDLLVFFKAGQERGFPHYGNLGPGRAAHQGESHG